MNRIIQILLYISDMLVPFLILYVVAHGLLARRPVYDDFVKGAKDGFQTVFQIMPTLVGLMVAVGVLRASGFLDFLSETLGRMTELVHFPSELVPLTIVRMFSASAATGLALDIFKEYGTDSYLGLTASILMGCTETIFYTMSVYFMTAKVKKTRYTLAGALLASAAGLAASVLLAFGVLFLPVVLRQLPLSGDWERRKTSLYLVSFTALLVLLIAVCAVVYGG